MNGSVLHFQGFCGVSPWFPVTVRNAARNHTLNCAQDLEHFFLLRDKGATLHTLLTMAGTPMYSDPENLKHGTQALAPLQGNVDL